MNMRKIKKQAYAVSPVIATLMLVLVSVGSAGVFYVWQSNWQEGTTDSVEDTDVKATLQLGGSSTVYPVTVDAAEAFMEEFPQFKVETKSGGSDSGIIGAGEGILDIGAASKNPSSSDFEKYPDMVVTRIGYDGVVLITTNPNITAMNATVLKAIYSINGQLDSDYELDGTGIQDPDDTYIEWNDIETYPGSGEYCEGDEIHVYDRAEKSGTEECFTDKLCDDHWGKSQIAPSGEHADSVTSNQELIDAIAADDDALGFMAYGIAADRDDVEMISYAPYHAEGYEKGDETTDDFINVTSGGLPNYGDIGSGVYKGSRPLNYITMGDPGGLEEKFIQFVLWSSNNQQFLHDNAYVSIYD